MLQECRMSDYQRKFSMENFRKKSALKAAKRNATKTLLKPRLSTSIFLLSLGNRLNIIEQSGVALSIKEQLNMKQRESVTLKENTKRAKREPTDQHQSHFSPSSLAVFATDSLELKLA